MTFNQLAAAAALRKNIMLRANGGASISLRSTRTSEISSFVKNCNNAENFALRKELNIWHKDTNFAVRKVSKKQDDMYRALLKLSRTKKLIKVVKKDEVHDREEMRRWIHSKRRNRSGMVDLTDEDLIQYEESGIRQTCGIDTTQQRGKQVEVLKINFPESATTHQQIMTQTTEVESELTGKGAQRTHAVDSKAGMSSLTQLNVSKHNHNTGDWQSKTINCGQLGAALYPAPREGIKLHVSNDGSAIEAVDRANHHYNGVKPVAALSLGQAHMRARVGPIKTGLTAERPPHALRLKNTKFPSLEETKPLTEEELDTTSSSYFQHTEGSDEVPDQTHDRDQVSVSVNHPDRGKTRPRRKRIKLKSNRPDPTQEIINNSSIAVRPGKSYDVTVYKKGESGDFEADMTSWNTTVDVAKYFNLSLRREKLQREKLLEDAREKEAQQRHRVDKFLEKLSRELETDERAKNYNRYAEEAKLKMQRRLEALKRGPPKYGDGDLKTVPNYVRIYPRTTLEEKNHPRKIRKRSSWSVPSLFTLQIAAANPRLVPPIPGGVRNPPTVHDASSHLVNINIDKYLLDAANS